MRDRLYIMNIRELTDCFYLYCLTLTVLKNQYETSGFVHEYVKRTQRYGRFNTFRAEYHDLNMLIYAIYNRDVLEKCIHNEADRKLFNRIAVSMEQLQRWLRDTYRGVHAPYRDRRFLLNLEDGLYIDKAIYKTLRRLVPEWRKLDKDGRALVINRLLHDLQTRFRRSELLYPIKALISMENLTIPKNEPSDITVDKKKKIVRDYLGSIGYGAFADKRMGRWSENIDTNIEHDIEIIDEDASIGSTSSASIASVPAPLGKIIKRNSFKKRKK